MLFKPLLTRLDSTRLWLCGVARCTVHSVGYSSHQQRRRRQCSEVDRSAKTFHHRALAAPPCGPCPVRQSTMRRQIFSFLAFSSLAAVDAADAFKQPTNTLEYRVRIHRHSRACTAIINARHYITSLPPSLPLLLIYLHNQCDAPWFALALACGLRLAMAFFSLFVSSSFFKVGVHFLRYCALVYAVNVYCTVHQYSTNNNNNNSNNISGSGEGFIFYDPASC